MDGGRFRRYGGENMTSEFVETLRKFDERESELLSPGGVAIAVKPFSVGSNRQRHRDGKPVMRGRRKVVVSPTWCCAPDARRNP